MKLDQSMVGSAVRRWICNKFNLVPREQYHYLHLKLIQRLDEMLVDVNLEELERIVSDLKNKKESKIGHMPLR